MDGFDLPPMERRLQGRYATLVKAHMHTASTTAAGPTAGLADSKAFAATQGAWRFFNNPRVDLPTLIQPLQEAGRRAGNGARAAPLLVIHDWSKLSYHRHASKEDTVELTHERDVGYELATALLVSGSDGSPLAPMQFYLKTAAGMLGTDPQLCLDGLAHIDQIEPTMEASRSWGLNNPLVHIIDREADSVAHYRRWDAAGHRFLVRGDDRRVRHEGRSMLLSAVARRLFADKSRIVDGGEVQYRGRPARNQVVETEVTLDRPGRRRKGSRQHSVPGEPLTLRLVVSRIIDARGRKLATWYLLTNVGEEEADTKTIARWYYWRWRIESYFKLLKSQGQQIEHWQQETGPAIARRLLVAAMACVVVWELQQEQSEESRQLKDLLVRLSGRQMKRSRPHTDSALLAGLFVLLPMLALIDEYEGDLTEITTLVQQTLPFLDTG